jgi:hypothetical protein
MRFPLTDTERRYLDGLWRDLRNATHQANTASAEWNRRNDELNDLADRSGWDDQKTVRVKGANQLLNDAFSGWNFWQQEVRRLAAAVQAEHALRELMGLVDDDPSGLRYERDDEPPVRPVPPHVEGFSVTGRARRGPNSSPAGFASDTRREAHSSGPEPAGVELGAVELGGSAAPAPAGGGRR